MSAQKISILTRGEEESWHSFSRRVKEAEGEVIVVLTSADNNFLLQEDERKLFLSECAKLRYRVKLATKEPVVIAAARKQGIRVFDRTRSLKKAIAGHEKSAEALRFFSPSLWRQQWRSRLQNMGLLSLPKLRIWLLIMLSASLFFFVVFRLLPSADVEVQPREDVVTQTMNIVLYASGATAQMPAHVRTLPLTPITVELHRTITFDQISPQFIGTSAEVTMSVINKRSENVLLRKGTRVSNQAGVVFRTQKAVSVPGMGMATVRAKADDLDIYDKVIGARGNVPPGLTWMFPALSPDDQKLLYATNKVSGAGGTTAFRTVLEQRDIDKATDTLKRQLLADAKGAIEEQRRQLNLAQPGARLELLNKEDLIRRTYSGFILPTDMLGKEVTSIPVRGNLVYTVPAYDLNAILAKFSGELQLHIGEGKQLLQNTVSVDPQRVVVIEYADNLSWIKITADIVGTEQFVLDPLTPTGVRFGKQVRDAIAGLGKQDALRIVKNLPEVERAGITIWPPWSGQIPSIPSNISISSP